MDPNNLKEIFEKLKKEYIPTSQSIVEGFANMLGGAESLSREFGIGRQRMEEIMGAVADATPGITKLGGDLRNVVSVMDEIGKATRRNVVADEEQVSKLYASSEILKQEVGTIVDSFQEIGVEFTQVGGKIEDSIQYIQSVGGNVKKIMGDVLNNMSAMNRFNFQDGVVGFTKMAAQAAILKTDMRYTLEFAEKALDPDEAIKLSSAFQRLGVSVGDLTDPFMLMNKSLNDPAGLQDSIVKMTQQFTYFDEKANQFKINPQGMLMLREIGREAGISSQELSKMALNAADFDKKVSQISPEIKFAKEEDRIYLANIAKMGDGGKYQVSIDDRQIELEKLTQDQIDNLIEEQKKGPKTVEELQRSTLDTLKVAGYDLKAIKDKVVFGVVSAPTVRQGVEGARGVVTSLSGALEESTDMKFFREASEKSMEAVRSIVSKMYQGEGLSGFDMKNLEKEFGNLTDLQYKVDDKMRGAIELFLQKNSENNTEVGRLFQDFFKKQYDESDLKKRGEEKKQTSGRGEVSSEIMGEIKTTSSSIINRIDGVNNKLDRMTNPQPSGNANQSTITEIVKEIQTSVVKQGQVTVGFDSSKPIKIDLNLTSDGKIDMARLENSLLNNEKLSESLAMNIQEKFKTMNYSPIVEV